MSGEIAQSSVLTKFRIRSGAQTAFFAWQARLAAAAAAAPGFLSIEFLPVPNSPREWQMVLQFHDAQRLAEWRGSRCRILLYEEAQPLLDQAAQPDEAAAPDFHAQGSVTEAIATRVRPGREAAFLDWSAKIQRAQAEFAGYCGTYLQAPSPEQPFWTTLIRFAGPEQLDRWLASAERRRLIAESAALVESWSSRRLTPAFAGWFPAEDAGATPPSWKQAMVVLLMLFPIVMLELHYLVPLMRGLDPVLGTFIGNAISVSLLAWPVMSVANRALDWWLRPPAAARRWSTSLGTVFLLGLFALEILVFRRLI
jgi:antibiotic biosynthesis monooxygenase (ABM) superfamily enzyme